VNFIVTLLGFITENVSLEEFCFVKLVNVCMVLMSFFSGD